MLNPPGFSCIIESGGYANPGVTAIWFTRALVVSDPNNYHRDITTGAVAINAAIHETDTIEYHGINNKNSYSLDFYSGAISTSGLPHLDARETHGSMMFLAWMVFFPFGILAAGHLKFSKRWFEIHIILQVIGFTMVCVAFTIAVQFTQEEGNKHFRATHMRLGLACFIAIFVQMLLGIVSHFMFNPDRKRPPIFPDLTHWFFGYAILVLSFVTIYFGLYEIQASRTIYILLSVWLGFIVVLGLVLTILRITGNGLGKILGLEDEK